MIKILVDKMPVKAEECPFSTYYSKTCVINEGMACRLCFDKKCDILKECNTKENNNA